MDNGVPLKIAYYAVFWLTVGLLAVTILLYIVAIWVLSSDLKELRQFTSHLGALGFGYLSGGYAAQSTAK